MRIGILTFHRSINNGAVMQCYSLAKKLQQRFPNDIVEVIDYHMPKVEAFYSVSYRDYFREGNLIAKFKRLILLFLEPTKIQWKRERKQAFENAVKQLPLSDTFILDDNQDDLFAYINHNYDVVIAGSDAIWNYNMRGYPNPYFLSDKIQCPKMAYAASCYGMSYEKITDHQKEEICNILSTYRFLGIRDNESGKMLEEVGCNIVPVHTCDPTVFLDTDDLPINVDDLKKKLISRGFCFDRETIAIMGSENMCRMVRRMFGRKYQIVSLYNRCRNADVNLHDLSPFEWAYVFRFAKITFTTFFHGTLLSLRNGIPVICIALETEYSHNHMTKVEDFLRRVGLQDWYFSTDYRKVNFDAIKKTANELISGDYAEMILEKMDREAKSFEPFYSALETVINDDRGKNQ